MNEKQIEDFIAAHREAFDDQELPKGLWAAIDNRLSKPAPTQRMVPLRSVLQVAAGIAVLIAFSIWALFLKQDATSRLGTVPSGSESALYEIYPEFAETAGYYQQQMESVQRELAAFSLGPENFESMRALDEELLLLEADLAEGADQAKVIEQMMHIYRMKLQTLEQMLGQLRNNQYYENSSDEVVVVVI